jgi:hypothetical protein
VEIDDPYDSGQATTPFGWRGADRGAQEPRTKPRLTVVAHPGLYSPQEFALPPALNDELVVEFGMRDGPPRSGALRARRWEERDYFDPVDKKDKLAGFAPVGKTGYVVGVATPHERALGANQRHVDSLLGSMALLNFGFLLVALVAIGATLREGRLPPRRDD